MLSLRFPVIGNALKDRESIADESNCPVRWAVSYITPFLILCFHLFLNFSSLPAVATCTLMLSLQACLAICFLSGFFSTRNLTANVTYIHHDIGLIKVFWVARSLIYSVIVLDPFASCSRHQLWHFFFFMQVLDIWKWNGKTEWLGRFHLHDFAQSIAKMRSNIMRVWFMSLTGLYVEGLAISPFSFLIENTV